ncbi:MAG: MMPL family transporter [Lachnospiraceae bacterium]|nr:MMPL family transporter [Lachnospiraceae bacterium]
MGVKIGKGIVKFRVPIFILALLLLIPSAIGYLKTKVNYDILSYLPKDIETMVGQDILLDEFGTGAFSMVMVDGMDLLDVSKLKSEIEDVNHVSKVVWYDSFADLSIPMTMIPDELYDRFNSGDSTLMMITFDTGTSDSETMKAIKDIRALSTKQCYISGMSAVVSDTKDLCDKETPIYVAIAVALSFLVLSLTMDSFLIPLFFLLSIGFAIIYNLGTNLFLGQISYITKALTAVLQLGVTMDYSIFLWHSYKEYQDRYPGEKQRAMGHAISNTFVSVFGSSFTTIAGFISLCFMSFTLGLDLGIVMAKGVLIGVVACVTVLPSMIMIFDKAIEKTSHKTILPNFDFVSKFVTKHYIVFAVLLVVLIVPAIYCYKNTPVYYNLDSSLPKDLECIKANTKLSEEFNMNAVDMILVDSSLDDKEVRNMISEIEDVDGMSFVISLDSLVGPTIPKDMLPDKIKEIFESKDYKMILAGTEYKVASDEVNEQCTKLSKIIKSYDHNGMLVGEAPCTKDLIDITDKDFKTVSIVSIGVIFLLIFIIFKSISLPIILVSTIEFAIFINMGIPYLTNTTLPFVASIVIGTIQLGSTVDYAILMTNRYKKERRLGKGKVEAVTIAHGASINSIIVSALSFFAATFGVGVYSEIDMISSLCILMARGAIISMFVVLLILPSMFIIFDKLICLTSAGFKPKALKPTNKSINA